MAKPKPQANEREYIIPLRREILKVPRHKRTPKAVKAVKQFLAKHMRIKDRDVTKIRLDYDLNHELWHRGIRHPPTKIKVKAKRDGDVIRVTLVDLPAKAKFRIAREEKKKKALEKPKKAPKAEEKKEEPKEQSEEQKKEESEKKESAKEVNAAQAKSDAKTQKHTQSAKEQKTQPKRKALQK